MIRRKPVPTVSRVTAAAFAVVLSVVAVLMVVPLVQFDGELREGDIAPATFEAARDAQFESAALTEAARQEAAAAVEEVALPVDSSIRDEQAQWLDRYLSQVRAIISRNDLTDQQKADQIANLSTPKPVASVGRSALQALISAGFDAFQARVVAALTELMSSPIKPELLDAAIDEYLAQPGNTPTTTTELTAAKEVLRAFVVANFQVDVAATEARRAAAIAGRPRPHGDGPRGAAAREPARHRTRPAARLPPDGRRSGPGGGTHRGRHRRPAAEVRRRVAAAAALAPPPARSDTSLPAGVP